MGETRTTTICFLLKAATGEAANGEILLAMKKRGFGVGKWNGCGGKVEAGESIAAAAARELSEEVQVTVAENDLGKVGELTFHLPQGLTVHSHVFAAERWTGTPAETEEMAPRWFRFTEIPYRAMWADDELWLPRVIAGGKVSGEFWFGDDGETLTRHELRDLNAQLQ
jgi:ADP-ribose pyrophosphatase YjhB (NUDIX family)